jgi:hypothetical protein
VVNCEPWHGHANWLPVNPVIMHPSWVHVAVRAVNEFGAVWATRNVPNDVCTLAAEPTAVSAEAASTVIDTIRPVTDAVTDASGGADVDGDVELPPQAATVPRASIEAA